MPPTIERNKPKRWCCRRACVVSIPSSVLFRKVTDRVASSDIAHRVCRSALCPTLGFGAALPHCELSADDRWYVSSPKYPRSPPSTHNRLLLPLPFHSQ